MNRSNRLREDALAIWQAGVDAVRSDHLVQQTLRVEHGSLLVDAEGGGSPVRPTGRDAGCSLSENDSRPRPLLSQFALNQLRRIVVVGCGKAGAGMAAGVEAALGDALLEAKDVQGWINVPEDCVRPLQRIHLHAARPAGVNEPTEAGVQGAQRILQLIGSLGPDDLCLCLISGGGSALLPAPAPGLTLADKQAITKHLSGAGANIQQLNTVRKQLSRVKGGRLAQACGAGHLISLIISDVLGDPLDVIASGPTVSDSSTPQQALQVLEQFGAREAGVRQAVFDYLEQACAVAAGGGETQRARVTNLIIGNNAAAVTAAACEAKQRGYTTTQEAVTSLEGAAEEVGRQLARRAAELQRELGKHCFISGGEPTVRLVPAERRGLGGRNQQLTLAALEQLLATGGAGQAALADMVLLSGGTDGEDGPTDAAGAVIDQALAEAAESENRMPADFLARNDAYHFFEPLGGLIKTGPTHTNVCDLRVVATQS